MAKNISINILFVPPFILNSLIRKDATDIFALMKIFELKLIMVLTVSRMITIFVQVPKEYFQDC